MIVTDLTNIKVVDTVEIECDGCQSRFWRVLKVHNQQKKRQGGADMCTRCSRASGARKRPQNNPEFLAIMRQSDAYRVGIANRPSIAGANNPNWGKTASDETRRKMSISRTGKVGERATSWKGGRTSFNFRIKSALQRRYKWFHRVIDRDTKCINCGATKGLDAHHIVPIAKIIGTILHDHEFATDAEKFEFVIAHPLIMDVNLDNGICLCRVCHKQIHMNWGSHEPKVHKGRAGIENEGI